ncbi:M23 family metallopeptidase [Jatrophihabitans endophyticus]|uniref:M23 family metallopeptidase n=1 Tax=Jatrophihabitans endophyticus TaxID=1206085 RepID=UPI0026F1EC49|nr:M23 family metallopeptidase [Jatrophihabitans endophyticus]
MTVASTPTPARLVALTAAVLALGGAGAWAAPDAPGPASVAATPVVHYVAPVPPPLHVLTAFDPPADPYGPGHLGVDLDAGQGAAVRAAGPGTVVFAGPVAGRGVVVIAHADGIRTEYEPLRVAVHAGAAVAGGTLIGHVDGRHAACAPASCLHWGARRGDTYLDPLDLLRSLGPVRLLPWTGPAG